MVHRDSFIAERFGPGRVLASVTPGMSDTLAHLVSPGVRYSLSTVTEVAASPLTRLVSVHTGGVKRRSSGCRVSLSPRRRHQPGDASVEYDQLPFSQLGHTRRCYLILHRPSG